MRHTGPHVLAILGALGLILAAAACTRAEPTAVPTPDPTKSSSVVVSLSAYPAQRPQPGSMESPRGWKTVTVQGMDYWVSEEPLFTERNVVFTKLQDFRGRQAVQVTLDQPAQQALASYTSQAAELGQYVALWFNGRWESISLVRSPIAGDQLLILIE